MSTFFLKNINFEKQAKELKEIIERAENIDKKLNELYQLSREENNSLEIHINEGSTININLIKFITDAKSTISIVEKSIENAIKSNNDLNASNSLADQKNIELKKVLDEVKLYIDSLEDSMNIPNLALEINRLKSRVLIDSKQPDNQLNGDVWIELK